MTYRSEREKNSVNLNDINYTKLIYGPNVHSDMLSHK